MEVRTNLTRLRTQRGIAAARLAGLVGISRQTVYAIEAGTYVPNTEVALHLARELEVTVDELFSLHAGTQTSPESLSTEVTYCCTILKVCMLPPSSEFSQTTPGSAS